MYVYITKITKEEDKKLRSPGTQAELEGGMRWVEMMQTQYSFIKLSKKLKTYIKKIFFLICHIFST